MRQVLPWSGYESWSRFCISKLTYYPGSGNMCKRCDIQEVAGAPTSSKADESFLCAKCDTFFENDGASFPGRELCWKCSCPWAASAEVKQEEAPRRDTVGIVHRYHSKK